MQIQVFQGNKWDKQRVIFARRRVTGVDARINRAGNPVYSEKSLLPSQTPQNFSRQRLENPTQEIYSSYYCQSSRNNETEKTRLHHQWQSFYATCINTVLVLVATVKG